MTTFGYSSGTVGWAAIVTGAIGVLAIVFIGLFYTIGEPFGMLSDICNALLAVSSGFLVWVLYDHFKEKLTSLNQILLIIALIGTMIAVVGSVLVIFKYTGWVLAGLYTSVGFALIGLWIIGFNYTVRPGSLLPNGMSTFGLVLGVIMLLGFAAIPGILKSTDSLEAMHPVINGLWQTASLGWLLLNPIWCIWLGRWFLTK